jgi:hypothetical protein
MIEHLEFDSPCSAASIVEQFGESAPDLVAAWAVEQLTMQDFDAYVSLRRMLKDVEDLLAGRRAAEAG